MAPRINLSRPLRSLLKRDVAAHTPRRTMVAAPKVGSGPLMERRADRELPNINASRQWMLTIPLFLVAMGASCFAIFNYQKQSSSVVESTLYSLRINDKAREILGDEVYFGSQFPWIHGEIDQLHGIIDINFWVKGTKRQALMRFRSERKHRLAFFETTEWSLKLEDGTIVHLLDASNDPSKHTAMADALQPQAAA